MNTNVIIDNVVINTIVATVEEASIIYPDALCLNVDEYPGGIGWTWDGEKLNPPPQPTPDYAAQNKTQAMSLLQSTDWVELPSVSDPQVTPHLENVNEFLAYRAAVRAIAVNPPTEPAEFPELPTEQWK